ncbi:MAG: uncharacterized protein JWM78_1605 [Verrucomicrobiaceae bacterium]|nr:uncharacterized protein [Verrucomicrobiaceae bacterium]
MAEKINLDNYKGVDTYFGKPYIDRDEWRDSPAPHRQIHGGFSDTDTRFTFYYPPQQHYQSRMFQPLEGAHAGHEDAFAGAMGELIGGLGMITRLGGYMVESNSGHIGDDIDQKGGDDPTIYGHRANVESARFSRFVAAQVYGKAPDYCYVWGGSGGGRRSPLCLEYGADVYAGALPFMGGGNIEAHGTQSRVRSDQPVAFGSMFNVQRLLGDKLAGVIDATQPGGSGDPYVGLTVHEREELANLYRLGFPRGDEFLISNPMGQTWLWTSIADMLLEEDAEYFSNFWTKPGYVGHDQPDWVSKDRIDTVKTVTRVITTQDLMNDPAFAGPEFDQARPMAMLMAASGGRFDLPIAVEVKGIGDGYRLGTGVKVVSGDANGRQLYCMNFGRDVLFCDGRREANLKRFTDVKVGDQVHIDNSAFLAFCYYYRYHNSADPLYDFLRVDSKPIYPQFQVPLASPLMGVPYSGQYEGKLLWIHHTHDSSLWPPQGIIYQRAVQQAQGAVGAQERFRLRWTENAEHIPPMMLSSQPNRASTSWLIDFVPIIEQSLVDLCDWAEKGIVPASTSFEFADGKVSLPPTAAERGGIQPVVSVKANGAIRTEVKTGQTVSLEVHGEVPEKGGAIIAVEWDFEGQGNFAFQHEVDGRNASGTFSTTYTYHKPGVYFPTARVISHRQGDVQAKHCRIPNVASVRVIVS